MLTESAADKWLTRCGQNYGVPRSKLVSDDEMFRRIVQVLGWQPKMVLSTVYWLMQAVFGSQADLVAASKRPWRIYEVVANELVIEVPLSLISTSNANASYLHGTGGLADNSTIGGAGQPAFQTRGDILKYLPAGAYNNLTVQIENTRGSGVFTSYTLLSVSYNAGTNISTVTCTANLAALAGNQFYIDVPGDDVTSYRGDYLAPSALEAAGGANPPVQDRVYLSGDGPMEIVTYYLDLLVLASGIALRIERV